MLASWPLFLIPAYAIIAYLLFKTKKLHINAWIILAILFVIKVLLAIPTRGFDSDMSCWISWSMTVASNPAALYTGWCDYPPGYMMLLYPIGLIRQLLHIPHESITYYIMLKLPSMIADVAIGYILYRMAKDKRIGRILMILFALNPMVLLNSSIWGQVDSVLMMFLLLGMIYLKRQQIIPAIVFYTIAATMKPQALLFAPIFIIAYALSYKKWKDMIIAGASSIAIFVLVSLPFNAFNLMWLFNLYMETFGGYKYATINAYNIYMLFGLNWKAIEGNMMYSSAHIVAILTATVVGSFIFGKKKDPYMAGVMITLLLFNFATQMHERYIFPALVLLFAMYAAKQTKPVLILIAACTIMMFLNCYHVLTQYTDQLAVLPLLETIIPIICLGNIGIFMYAWYAVFNKEGSK